MVVAADIYRTDVDFTLLALQHAGFAKQLKGNGQLDFSDPESVRQLTHALLKRDFDLAIQLPDNRLCPPVPNRFNYVVFVQKLVDSTRPDEEEEEDDDDDDDDEEEGGSDSQEQVLALDIGTGASVIYPLLACRQRPHWFFLATEIDAESRQYAQANIKTNMLESNVRIVNTDESGGTILPSDQFQHFDDYTIKVMMTNPPFYASVSEMQESAQAKSRPPNSACTGAPVEMITPGGEVEFVSRIIQESALERNRRKIQWFSSMLGKLSSVSRVVDVLKQVGCTNYALTEFVQGTKTRRWCVAWSWCGLRPPLAIARGIGVTVNGALEKKTLPFPTEFDFDLDVDANVQKLIAADTTSVPTEFNAVERIRETVDREISALDLCWKRRTPGATLGGTSPLTPTCLEIGTGHSLQGDVWSRKARRQRMKKSSMSATTATMDKTASKMQDISITSTISSSSQQIPPFQRYDIPLSFKITLSTDPPPPPPPPSSQSLPLSRREQGQKMRITIRWLQGHDPVLFESFCGWLKRRLL